MIPVDERATARHTGLTPPTRQQVRQIQGLPPAEQQHAHTHGITDAILARWPARYDIYDVALLHHAGVSPSQAAQWPTHLSAVSIVALVDTATNDDVVTITPDDLTGWPARFDGPDLVHLLTIGLEPDYAQRYGPQHNGDAIRTLFEHGVTPDIAAEYPSWMFAHQIVKAYYTGLTGDEIRWHFALDDEPDPGCRTIDEQYAFQVERFGEPLRGADLPTPRRPAR